MKTQTKADLALLMVTIFWGASCLLLKLGLEDIQAFNLIAVRFICAFILAAAIFYKRLMKVDRKVIGYAAILSGLLFSVQVSMTYGVKYTTVSNAGFLTCLAGIFVPIILFTVLKQKVERKVILSVFMAALGVYMITIKGQYQFNIGDILCVLCSFAFAAYIIVTDKLTKGVDSLSLGILQLGFVGLYGGVFSIFLEQPKFPATPTSWGAILALSVFCTAFAFIAQTIAQKHTSPTHTGLIFTLEPVFTAIFAFAFLNEVLTKAAYFGGGILLLSILLVELDMKPFAQRYFVQSDEPIE